MKSNSKIGVFVLKLMSFTPGIVNKNITFMRFKEPEVTKNPANFNTLEPEINLANAIDEAQLCLQCKNPPCVKACPIHNDIPNFIKLLSEGFVEKAGEILRKVQTLPSICGRVCFHKCESACVKGKIKDGSPIDIGGIERFIGDNTILKNNIEKETGKKVAIIGAGPAGLSAARELRLQGHQVVVYDSKPEAGGILRYGIPSFRLPEAVLEKELKLIRDLGVEFKLNTVIGRDITGHQLKQENYNAIFIASGASIPRKLNISGENLHGVYSASDFLKQVKLSKHSGEIDIGPNVLIIGAGNVAMDVARTVKRLGCDAKIIYRGAEANVKANPKEILDAMEEGVKFEYMLKPTEILGENYYVDGVKFEKMKINGSDENGKPILTGTGEFQTVKADAVITSLGSIPNNRIKKTLEHAGIFIESNNLGQVRIDKNTLETSVDGVFAGGDVAPVSELTLIDAIAAGKKAANSINDILMKTE